MPAVRYLIAPVGNRAKHWTEVLGAFERPREDQKLFLKQPSLSN